MLLDSWIDRTIQRLGYIKTRADKDAGRAMVWSGEAPLGSTVEDWSDWSDGQRERLAITSSWVYSDIRGIANEASQADVGIYERQGEELEEVIDHEFEQIMRRPNEFMGGAWLRQYSIYWWLLRGEAYWLKVFDQSGAVREIWPLPASRMRPIPDPLTYISGYGYRSQQGEPEQLLEVEQVCFFRFPNPFDYHRGLSPLSAYQLALETDVSAARWNRDFFNNGASLQMILSVPHMTQSQFEQVKMDIDSQLMDEQRRFLIGRAGDIKAEPVTVTQQDAEFLAGREFSRQEIDRIFGYPAGYWSERANRANAEAAKATFIEQAVWPLLVLMHDEITSQIVQPAYGEQYVARYQDIRLRNRDLELKEAGPVFPRHDSGRGASRIGQDTLPRFRIRRDVIPVGGQRWRGWRLFIYAFDGHGADEIQWRSESRSTQMARDRLAAAEESANHRVYDFESDIIDNHVKSQVMEALSSATTAEEVKAAFGGPFREEILGWEGYP